MCVQITLKKKEKKITTRSCLKNIWFTISYGGVFCALFFFGNIHDANDFGSQKKSLF